MRTKYGDSKPYETMVGLSPRLPPSALELLDVGRAPGVYVSTGHGGAFGVWGTVADDRTREEGRTYTVHCGVSTQERCCLPEVWGPKEGDRGSTQFDWTGGCSELG